MGILNYDYICIPSGNEIAIGIATIAIAALAGWAGVGAGALAPVLA